MDSGTNTAVAASTLMAVSTDSPTVAGLPSWLRAAGDRIHLRMWRASHSAQGGELCSERCADFESCLPSSVLSVPCKPLGEALEPLLDADLWAEGDRVFEVGDVGVGGGHVAGLLWLLDALG